MLPYVDTLVDRRRMRIRLAAVLLVAWLLTQSVNGSLPSIINDSRMLTRCGLRWDSSVV